MAHWLRAGLNTSTILVGLTLSSGVWTSGARAQTASDPAPNTPQTAIDTGAGKSQKLEDIIVTATRRAANVQDIPLSVSVIGQHTLESLNVTQTTDLVRLAPGLNFSYGSYGNSNSFVLRGVSTFANSNAIESSVGVAVDGVPLARTVGQISDIVDIERVEVLRGPQGTLFGKNSTAGIISVVTAKPDFDLGGSGRVYYGSGNEFRAQGVLNIPLATDVFAARLAVWSFSHDPYVTANNAPSDVGSFDNKGVRLRLRYRPSPDLDVNLISQYSREDDSAVGWYTTRGYVGITTGAVLTPAQLGQSRAAQNADLSRGVIAGANNYATSANDPVKNVVETLYNTLQVDYSLHEHKIALITSYQSSKGVNLNDGDQSANVAPALNSLISTYYADVAQFNAELRLVSPDGKPITYVAGLFYYDVSVDTRQDQIFQRAAPFIIGRTNLSDVHSVNYAAFGEVLAHLGSSTRLLAGGRIAHDDVTGHYRRLIPSPAIPIPNGAFGPIDIRPSTSYTNFSWRAGIQQDLADRTMAYFTVSRGYKGPGFNFTNDITVPQFAVNQAIVDPEHVTSYELGIKSQLFDNTLRFNTSLYYSRYTDFQVSAGLPTNPLSFALINAPLLIAKGGEAELEWRPRAGLTLSGNIAYSGAKFSRFANAPCFFGQSVAQGCVNGAYDVGGASLPNSPKWAGNVSARYEFRMGGLNLFGQANYYHKDSVYFSIGKDPAQRAPSYGVLGLTVGGRTSDDRIGLTFYAKNLLDEHFVGRLIVSGGAIGQNLPFESRARYGAAFDVRF